MAQVHTEKYLKKNTMWQHVDHYTIWLIGKSRCVSGLQWEIT